MNDFSRNVVTSPNQSEDIRQRLYDWNLYPAAGLTQINFFAQQQGQGITTALGAAVGSGKTFADTNQEVASSLPSGKNFLIETIEVLFVPGSVATANTFTPAAPLTFAAVNAAAVGLQVSDVNTFYNSGYLELNVLAKNFVREAPLIAFPPRVVMELQAAVATNSATTAISAFTQMHASGRAYYVDPQITLLAAVNFEVVLKWPGAVAMPSGYNGRVGVIMDGILKRAVQ